MSFLKYATAIAVMASSAQAAQFVSLPRTMDAGSVQAVLYNALQMKRQQDMRWGRSSIRQTADGLELSDSQARLVCQYWSSMGMLQVISHSCQLSANYGVPDNTVELTLTPDAASVQAVVHSALELLRDSGSRSVQAGPSGLEVRDNEATLEVYGGLPRGGPGEVVAQVMTYSLKLTQYRMRTPGPLPLPH